ncbi:glutamate-5-semialdehyde dehydrogenase [Deinococcus peraridilitoris]|uniref:Gamma-glutamyl phosphate reductase n=1 Tax=Deinococcus peraridilitoris (strain DSM 19664 / LMG 22246 / CIP 109416 / KR-200) TaxID=937777 RepID=L0A5L8_DEIPD|nr:glutamate-5-semialdehyde dehydrogenase [Deinococcus peraridilitoris]AFZ68477.1 gamma-glutamyl phosphate reductase [Deinococcus peraridilitoris DSM 19664]
MTELRNQSVRDLLTNAKKASKTLARAERNAALRAMQARLLEAEPEILRQNAVDVQQERQRGTGEALLDRLTLTGARLREVAQGIEQVIALPDPLGRTLDGWRHPKGMQIEKVSVPLGVIGVIYESRPNVTVDAAVLCLKAGSAPVLRGSASALNTNRVLVRAMRLGLRDVGLPEDAVTLIDSADRASVTELLEARGLVDLVIPRGGAGLIQHVVTHAKVPVIETGVGNCHLYVHRDADLEMALNILLNGKTQRPGVCNALETLLVDREIAPVFVPLAVRALRSAGVEVRGDEDARMYAPGVEAASDTDWESEFLDLILALRVVDGLSGALEHIARYGSQHSEAIVTSSLHSAREFQESVDAAAVYVNASTRFTDGFEFGFGAEIGISTQKMHARGPMGLAEMVTYQYRVTGEGQIR